LYESERTLRERLSFLAEASVLLSSSLGYERTLTQLAELCVPRLADWCTVDVIGDDGEIQRLAVAHPDPAMVKLAEELQDRYPPDPDAPHGVPLVLRTRESELIPSLTDEMLVEAAAGDEELLELLRRLDLRASLCVPL